MDRRWGHLWPSTRRWHRGRHRRRHRRGHRRGWGKRERLRGWRKAHSRGSSKCWGWRRQPTRKARRKRHWGRWQTHLTSHCRGRRCTRQSRGSTGQGARRDGRKRRRARHGWRTKSWDRWRRHRGRRRRVAVRVVRYGHRRGWRQIQGHGRKDVAKGAVQAGLGSSNDAHGLCTSIQFPYISRSLGKFACNSTFRYLESCVFSI